MPEQQWLQVQLVQEPLPSSPEPVPVQQPSELPVLLLQPLLLLLRELLLPSELLRLLLFELLQLSWRLRCYLVLLSSQRRQLPLLA